MNCINEEMAEHRVSVDAMLDGPEGCPNGYEGDAFPRTLKLQW